APRREPLGLERYEREQRARRDGADRAKKPLQPVLQRGDELRIVKCCKTLGLVTALDPDQSGGVAGKRNGRARTGRQMELGRDVAMRAAVRERAGERALAPIRG